MNGAGLFIDYGDNRFYSDSIRVNYINIGN